MSMPTDSLTDQLDGEFCYVQTSDGKIVSIHYALTDNYKGINIKRSIASTFQANFDSHKEDTEETDASSVHTSHYRCANVFVCLCACVCACVFMFACECVLVYMHACMHACMFHVHVVCI